MRMSTLLSGLFFVVLLSGNDAHCQIINHSNIYINGVDIHIDGEIRNEGLLRNNGAVALTGDWESKGEYNGDGVVKLIGATPQKLSHYEQSIHTLVVDGWGTKYIKGTTNVQAALHLQNGIVQVSPDDVLNLEDNVTISGGSSHSYVDGALTVQGTGYKFFPIGKRGTYAPVEFTNVTGDDPQFSVEVFEDAPLISIEDVIVRAALYWQRKDKRGRFYSSPIAIDYDARYFENPDDIILVTGTGWDDRFFPVRDVSHSTETDKITTQVPVSSPIILLGEYSEEWTQADFYFSTALSPNASHSQNTTVKIHGERLASDGFNFQVFDRWGAVVFETVSLEAMSSNGWDGRSLKGTQLTTGTYPYRISAREKTGLKFEKKGVITIVN